MSDESNPEKKKSLLRKAYEWAIGLSESPYSRIALFILAFLESCCMPSPSDTLLVSLCLGKPKSSFKFGTIALAASLLGGMAGYGVGMFAFEAIGRGLLDFYDPNREVFNRIDTLYSQWGFWSVIVAAITPIPYQVFTVASGVFKFSFWQFFLASAIGRTIRFFAMTGLFFWGGDRLKRWIERYFEWVAWGFLAFAFLSLTILKLLA